MKMKKRGLFALFFCAILLVCPLGARALSAQGAAMVEVESGRLLFGQNENERLPMASTTKIMTALVAVEQGDPAQICTVSPRAAKVEGSSLYLKAGEKYTLEQMLYGLLLRSGNDAATVIAENVAGSEAAFVELMNEKAAQLGLSNTHFDNPTGLDGETHYTTAKELALLTAAALQNESFCRYFGAKDYLIAAAETHGPAYLVNKHRLLESREDVIGGKTGYTKAAGRSLVTAARQDGLTLVVATINDPDDWNDHGQLLDEGFSAYERAEVSAMILPQCVPVAGGGSLTAKAVEEFFVTVPQGAGERLQIVYHLPRFCYDSVGLLDQVGQASVRLDGEELARLPLLCWEKDSPAAAKPGIWELITDAICTILK